MAVPETVIKTVFRVRHFSRFAALFGGMSGEMLIGKDIPAEVGQVRVRGAIAVQIASRGLLLFSAGHAWRPNALIVFSLRAGPDRPETELMGLCRAASDDGNVDEAR